MKFKNIIAVIIASLGVSLSSCNINNVRGPEFDNNDTNEPNENSNNELDKQLHLFYESAVVSQNFKGTFDEWIKFISGESGDMNVNKFTKEEILKAEYQKAVDSKIFEGTYEEWLNFITGINGPIDVDSALKSLYKKAIDSKKFNGTYEEWYKLISGEGGSLMPIAPDDPEVGLKEAYNKALSSKNFTGTYEEWLSFIKGENGPLIKDNETFKLSINFNNGINAEIRTYHKNEVVDLQNPTKPGYKFLNWTNNLGEVVTFPLIINEDIDIKANYQRNYAEAIFMNNGQVIRSNKYNAGDELQSLPTASDLNLQPNESLLYWYYLDNEQEIPLHLPFKFNEAKDYVFYPKIDSFNPDNVDQNLKADITYFTTTYSEEDTALLDDKIVKFNEIYPNINVNYVKAGKHKDIYQKIKTAYKTHAELPNIYDTKISYALEFQKYTDATLNLYNYESNDKYGLGTKFQNGTTILDKDTQGDNISNFIKAASGASYRPYNGTGYYWYVNKEEFAGCGKSPDAIIEKARELKAKYPERYPTNAYAPIAIHDLVPFFYAKSYNNDGLKFVYYDAKEATPRYEFNNVQVKALIKEYKQYYDEGLFLTNELRLANNGAQYIEDDFTKDNPSTFIVYDDTRGIPYLVKDCSDLSIKDKLSNTLAELKYVDGSLFEASTNSLGFFKHSENENIASWLLYKFLLTYKPTSYESTKFVYPSTKNFYENNSAYDNLMTYNTSIQKEDTYEVRYNKLLAQTYDEMKFSLSGYGLKVKPSHLTIGHFNDLFEDMICDVFNAKTDNFDLYLSNALDKLENEINEYKNNYEF